MSWNSFWKSIGNSLKKGWDPTPAHQGKSGKWYIGDVPEEDKEPIGGYITDWIETQTGTAEKKQAEKAQKLAEESQEFNEQYSKESLEEQARQFDKSQEMAQKNIDFQKEIAEKNLALQTDAFNAQLKENELTRQREDTAYQRQAADLKAAGFSPLMASNGANAASMSVGSAPQYDGSAVATAQGSAIQLAQEYATLRNMAQGQYLSRKQAAINERIGAIMALSELSANRRQNFQNLALSGANLAMSIRDMKKKHELLDAQIKATTDQNNWNNLHGYRNQNWLSALLPVIKEIGEHYNLNVETFLNKLDNLPEQIQTKIDNVVNKEGYAIREEIKFPELVKNFSNKELEDLYAVCNMSKYVNWSDKELRELADSLYQKIDSKRKLTLKTSTELYNWFKRDGFNNVCSVLFGIRL